MVCSIEVVGPPVGSVAFVSVEHEQSPKIADAPNRRQE